MTYHKKHEGSEKNKTKQSITRIISHLNGNQFVGLFIQILYRI